MKAEKAPLLVEKGDFKARNSTRDNMKFLLMKQTNLVNKTGSIQQEDITMLKLYI